MTKFYISGTNAAFDRKGIFVAEDMTTFAQWNRGARGRTKLVWNAGDELDEIIKNVILAKAASKPKLIVKATVNRKRKDLNYKLPKSKSVDEVSFHLEKFCITQAKELEGVMIHPMAAMGKAEYLRQQEECE